MASGDLGDKADVASVLKDKLPLEHRLSYLRRLLTRIFYTLSDVLIGKLGA